MIAPATIADAAAFWPTVRGHAHLPPGEMTYTRLCDQIRKGPSVAWRRQATDAPVLLAGLLPSAGIPSIAWFFAARPLGADLVPVVLALRRELRRVAADHPLGIAASVRTGNVAGRRLAVALGLRRISQVDEFTIWSLPMEAAVPALITAATTAGSAAVSYRNMQAQKKAQAEQAATLAAERTRIDGETAAMKKAAGGGRGLLAYVDQDLMTRLGGQ